VDAREYCGHDRGPNFAALNMPVVPILYERFGRPVGAVTK
jgi:hypothetical protein